MSVVGIIVMLVALILGIVAAMENFLCSAFSAQRFARIYLNL